MTTPDKPQCEAQVSEPPHYFHHHQCLRRGVYSREGRYLCRQHLAKYDQDGNGPDYARFYWYWK